MLEKNERIGRTNVIKKDDFGENERARELVTDPNEYIGLHDTTLYDENEDQHGQMIDEATGKPINNEQDIPSEQSFHSETEEKIEKLREELQGDIATDWLLKNGFDEFGNPVEKK